jgi:hypothetical protein
MLGMVRNGILSRRDREYQSLLSLVPRSVQFSLSCENEGADALRRPIPERAAATNLRSVRC